MTKESLTTMTAREYRKKFPDTPTLTLARKLYNDHRKLYNSIEHARDRLRVIEGKKGVERLKKLNDKSLVKSGERPRNPYNLPDSDEQEFIPYIVPDKCKKVLLLSDIHIPYHNIQAVTLALDYGKEKQIDTILINGDLIDFYQLSRFEKDPRKRSVVEELEATRAFLKILRDQFPKATIIYKGGNHDARLEKYLTVRAPELLGIQEFELSKLLKLDDLGITYVGDKTLIKLKSLNILHGHEFSGGAFPPVNIARGLFLKANATALQSHNHQTSEHTANTINGEMITTWSVACLCVTSM